MKRLNHGFTIVEVMMVTLILAFVIVSMMKLYIFTASQASLTENLTLAVSAAQDKMEEIRNHDYATLAVDYGSGGTPGDVFNLTQIDGVGKVTVDSSNAELLVIGVTIFWRDKYDRIIGEDTDLDGILDGGEDANSNGVLDSPVTLMSMKTRR